MANIQADSTWSHSGPHYNPLHYPHPPTPGSAAPPKRPDPHWTGNKTTAWTPTHLHCSCRDSPPWCCSAFSTTNYLGVVLPLTPKNGTYHRARHFLRQLPEPERQPVFGEIVLELVLVLVGQRQGDSVGWDRRVGTTSGTAVGTGRWSCRQWRLGPDASIRVGGAWTWTWVGTRTGTQGDRTTAIHLKLKQVVISLHYQNQLRLPLIVIVRWSAGCCWRRSSGSSNRRTVWGPEQAWWWSGHTSKGLRLVWKVCVRKWRCRSSWVPRVWSPAVRKVGLVHLLASLLLHVDLSNRDLSGMEKDPRRSHDPFQDRSCRQRPLYTGKVQIFRSAEAIFKTAVQTISENYGRSYHGYLIRNRNLPICDRSNKRPKQPQQQRHEPSWSWIFDWNRSNDFFLIDQKNLYSIVSGVFRLFSCLFGFIDLSEGCKNV